MNRTNEWWADLALRIGVAFAFLYPPVNALWNPESWIAYFPPFTRGYVPDEVLLHSFGALEVVIALWILSGKKIFLPSLAAAGILVAIGNPQGTETRLTGGKRDYTFKLCNRCIVVATCRPPRAAPL